MRTIYKAGLCVFLFLIFMGVLAKCKQEEKEAKQRAFDQRLREITRDKSCRVVSDLKVRTWRHNENYEVAYALFEIARERDREGDCEQAKSYWAAAKIYYASGEYPPGFTVD